ncbi:hypothetical protein GWI33_000149 [Rhynchophorus ferrugineus]|uniref:Uncharacterized protein n=1 Tax=Rhynchophorus ferrugineus TaxID=354439 RepID=A0A834IXJ7_RHYFE|nr:hypothetical protein GWI33_000149 [Rhynchophorus ferrugineus]
MIQTVLHAGDGFMQLAVRNQAKQLQQEQNQQNGLAETEMTMAGGRKMSPQRSIVIISPPTIGVKAAFIVENVPGCSKGIDLENTLSVFSCRILSRREKFHP